MKLFSTAYPPQTCKSFNEWCAYVRTSVVNAQLSKSAQRDIEAEAFVKSLKKQLQ